ncbi:kinase-like domain-containing protein [Haematococcus lacustris]
MAALSAQEWQWVYALTGQTGSCIYMAPEVQRCEPYNQAADTFSFGVLAYELLSRSMLVFTHLGGGMLPGVLTPEDYAARVADGYRPERPQSMTDDRVWELVSSCWAADPNTRPAMTTVAQALQVLAAQQAGLEEAEAAQRQGSRGLLAQCGLCHIQ